MNNHTSTHIAEEEHLDDAPMQGELVVTEAEPQPDQTEQVAQNEPADTAPAVQRKRAAAASSPLDFEAEVEPELREEDVLGAVVGYGFSDEEMQQYMQQEEWKEELKPQPTPALQPKEKEKKENHWKQLMVGDVSLIPNYIRDQILGKTEILTEEEQDYRLYGALNRSWAADHMGLSRDAVQTEWPRYRANIAKQLNVSNADEDVYLALSEREKEKPIRKAGIKVYEAAYAAGLEGKTAYDIEEHIRELSPEYQQHARRLAEKAFEEGGGHRDNLLPLAQRICDSLKAFDTPLMGSIPRLLLGSPQLVEVMQELSQFTREQRNVVFHVARSIAPPRKDTEENPFSTAAKAFNRSKINMAGNAAQSIAQVAAGALHLLGMVDASQDSKIRKLSQSIDKYSIVFEELRRLAHNELHPLVPRESSGWAGQYLVDLAGALPDAITSFSQHAAMTILRDLNERGQRIMDIRMRAPEASPSLAVFAGSLGLSLRRVFENKISAVGGNKLAKSITRMLRNRGGGVKKFAMHSGKVANSLLFELVREMTAEKVGETVALGTEEAILYFSNVASHLNWREYGESLIDISTNMREAAVELPFILLGAGKVTLQDFSSPQSLLGRDGAALNRWGISDKERQDIMAEKDVDKQSEMLRKALCGSHRWGGMDFLRRAGRALRLLNLDSFTEFNDPEFVRDFMQLPATLESGQLVEMKDTTMRPDSGFLTLNSMQHADPEYQRQVAELWNESWLKSRYGEDVSYIPMPDWTCGEQATPIGKRLALYLSEIHFAPRRTVPSRLMRDGLYSPHAEKERRALLRDRVLDVNNISHLFSLNSYAMDSLSEKKIPIAELKQHAEDARQFYLRSVVGGLMRVAAGEDLPTVMNDVEKQILHHFRHRLDAADYKPLWTFKLAENMPEQVPALDSYRNRKLWAECIQNPDLLEVYRICVGTRANLKLLSNLLPLTNDYYTALSRGMSPLAAQYHLLKREFPDLAALPPDFPVAQWENAGTPADYEDFCRKNNELYEKSRQIFGELVHMDKGENGQELWRAQFPDGSFSRWHESRQHAINDLMVHTQVYFQPFRADILSEGYHRKQGSSYRKTESINWFSKKNHFLGFDQLFSHVARDTFKYWHERAHLTQPGLMMNRVRKKFHSDERSVGDGASPVYPWIDFRHGKFDVDHFSVVSPIAYMQARFYVFWARMLESGRVNTESLNQFLERKCEIFPALKQTMDDAFALPLGDYHKYRFRRFGEKTTLAKKMSAFSTCYVLAHPEAMTMPQSYHTWRRLVPYSESVDGLKYNPGEEPNARPSVPRGTYDSPVMSWLNRKSAAKMQDLMPLTLDMGKHPVFDEENDAEVVALVRESMGQDYITRSEYAWTHALCGEPIFRSLKQHWFNFLREPCQYWEDLPKEDQERLVEFLTPEIRRGELEAQAERNFDPELAEMTDQERVEMAIEEMAETLEKYPELRQYNYADARTPYANSMALDDEAPVIGKTDEPVYTPLPLYKGSAMKGGQVGVYGHFVPDADMPPQVENALRLLSLIRQYPVTRPICQGGTISWRGVVYGGKKGKAPYRTDTWTVDDNPLEPLLLMREKVDKIEEAEMEDAIIHFPLMYNSVYPDTHDEVFGNVTVYRHPTIPMNISRLMPGEPFALHPRALSPYVVQCRHGSYLLQRTLADTLELQGEAMQPLDKFHPWGNQNRAEARINEGRVSAIGNNLHMAVHRSFDFNQQETPINVSPRELLMRLAIDTGYLETIKNTMPYQMDYGSALTYNLVNALYEYSCHPEMPEARDAWDEITSRLRDNENDYNMVFKVLRESSRSTRLAEPVAPLFDWHDSIEPYVRDAQKRKEAQAKLKKPGLNPMSEADRYYLDDDDEDMEAEPLDEEALELFSYNFADEYDEYLSQPLFPGRKKLKMRPVDRENKSIWGELFNQLPDESQSPEP